MEAHAGVQCPVDRDFADYVVEYLTDPRRTLLLQIQDVTEPRHAGVTSSDGSEGGSQPESKSAKELIHGRCETGSERDCSGMSRASYVHLRFTSMAVVS
jgi:hypothetical protein